MKYYAVADIHGFYDELITALEEQGFFKDTAPHKLIVCGDLFDRGSQALRLQEFILDLLLRDEVILIRGNHEDLAADLLNKWQIRSYLWEAHRANGTLDTVCQLTGASQDDIKNDPESVEQRLRHSPFIETIIPAMRDFYETEHYIFVHGWIPCTALRFSYATEYFRIDDWRAANGKEWDNARWLNGMEAAHSGVTERGKTIVCGHWHCSFGHSHYEGRGGEFDESADFSPYYGSGIIALDACTAVSGRVNCVVLED